MNDGDIIQAMKAMARAGTLSPTDAMAHLAGMIEKLDKLSPDYEADVGALLAIGACIWQLDNVPF
jgi:hypothetical protein